MIVGAVTEAWAEDPESDVVWAGDFEGRRGVRVRQTVRDFTTIWFSEGQRTLSVEAYVLPPPPAESLGDALRIAMIRNRSVRRAHFALDRDGAIVLVAKIPVDEVDEHEMELVLAEIYELVEITFRPLVRAAFNREKLA